MTLLDPVSLAVVPRKGFGFIYCIESPFGKQYIGKSLRSLGSRFRRHCFRGRVACPAIFRAITKYGPDRMRVYLLGEYPREELGEAEVQFIRAHNTVTPNGYNLSYGGDTLRVVLTKEARWAMGDGKRGTHISQAHKDAISARHKGTHRTEEQKRAMSLLRRGRKSSPETIAKLRASLLRRNWRPSPEHLAKMIAARHPNYVPPRP